MSVLIVMIDGAQIGDYEGLSFVKNAEEAGFVNNTPPGMEADSLACIMNLLGVSPQEIPTGRAYLESLALGNVAAENEIFFRCNGVEIEGGLLKSSCIFRELPPFNGEAELISLGGYKNLLLLKNCGAYFDDIQTAPPHDHIGEDITPLLPQSTDWRLEEFLRELIISHNLWAWGQAIKTKIPTFYELHRLSGAVVCKTEIVKGIAKAMGMFCPELKNATAEVDTNLAEKARVALDLSREYDLTLLHINGADEAAHRRDSAQKADFIRRIEHEVIRFLLDNLPPETALIVLSDHATDAKTGKHKNEPVNYYIFNQNKECDRWLKRL